MAGVEYGRSNRLRSNFRLDELHRPPVLSRHYRQRRSAHVVGMHYMVFPGTRSSLGRCILPLSGLIPFIADRCVSRISRGSLRKNSMISRPHHINTPVDISSPPIYSPKNNLPKSIRILSLTLSNSTPFPSPLPASSTAPSARSALLLLSRIAFKAQIGEPYLSRHVNLKKKNLNVRSNWESGD